MAYSISVLRSIENSAWEALRALYPAGTRRIACNWRIRRGELDAVLLEPDGVLVSVEIRFRASPAWGGALESIGPRKWAHWMGATRAFAQRMGDEVEEVRMDLWWNEGLGWELTSGVER
mgnify:FL=1